MELWSAPSTTDTVHRITAPQPPRLSTDGPSAVIRKLGFASATTNPSNQLMVLRSSRSSTAAVAMHPPRGVGQGENQDVEDETGFAGRGQDLLQVLWCPLQSAQRMGEDIDMKGPRITLRCD